MHSAGAPSEHVVSDFYGTEQEVLIKWVTEAHSFWILIILKPVSSGASVHSSSILGANEQHDPQLRALTPSSPEVEIKRHGHLTSECEGKARGGATSFSSS